MHTVYPKKYAHGFVVLCFVVVIQSFIMNSHEVFIHIHRGCFAGIGAIVRLPQCQWSKPDGYGKISQCITTTKHSKAKTVCTFLGIYCRVCCILFCPSPKDFRDGAVEMDSSVSSFVRRILGFPCISGTVLKLGECIHYSAYGTPHLWLTLGHAPPNSRNFLATDCSSSSHAFWDRPLSRLISIQGRYFV